MHKMAEDSPAEIAAVTCNETEALLQVKYNITASGITRDFNLRTTVKKHSCVFKALRWPGTKTLPM